MYIKNKIKFVNEDTTSKKESFYCQLCNYPLITMLDFEKSNEYNACNECYLEFIESRRKDWKEGWRPDKSALHEYIYLRKQLDKRINNNK